jgi:hypothetical protein
VDHLTAVLSILGLPFYLYHSRSGMMRDPTKVCQVQLPVTYSIQGARLYTFILRRARSKDAGFNENSRLRCIKKAIGPAKYLIGFTSFTSFD